MLWIGFAATGVLASAANAQWVEAGDAGQLPGTAQGTTVGPSGTPLVSIAGTFGTITDADMYCIQILAPTAFSVTTVGGSTNDTQLFLFNTAGMGIAANDDSAGTAQSTLPLGNPLLTVLTPGTYLLAISTYNIDPTSAGGLIFPNSPFTNVFGPTGPGGGSPVTGWTGSGATGSYTISLTGAGAWAVPAPGAIALLGLAGLVGTRRRRN
jgi:hypothetical protein